jgi:hypothetical protein
VLESHFDLMRCLAARIEVLCQGPERKGASRSGEREYSHRFV